MCNRVRQHLCLESVARAAIFDLRSIRSVHVSEEDSCAQLHSQNALRLFRPQRFDRIEKSCFSCRVIAKTDSNQRGEKHRKGDRAGANGGCPAREARNESRGADSEDDAGDPACDGKCYRFNQKLSKDIVRLGSDGLAQSDFACPFPERNQHDIHDADTAHYQRHGSNGGQHDRHDARRRFLGREQLLQITNGKVVGFRCLQMMTLTKKRLRLVLSSLGKSYAGRQHRALIAGANFKAPADLPKTLLHSEYSESDFPRAT